VLRSVIQTSSDAAARLINKARNASKYGYLLHCFTLFNSSIVSSTMASTAQQSLHAEEKKEPVQAVIVVDGPQLTASENKDEESLDSPIPWTYKWIALACVMAFPIGQTCTFRLLQHMRELEIVTRTGQGRMLAWVL
jgi:hypothetical protein